MNTARCEHGKAAGLCSVCALVALGGGVIRGMVDVFAYARPPAWIERELTRCPLERVRARLEVAKRLAVSVPHSIEEVYWTLVRYGDDEATVRLALGMAAKENR